MGSNGVTQGVIGAATQALKDHELIKVKIADERDGRAEAVAALAKGTGAEVAQTLGRTVLLFKKRSKNSKFEGILKLVASEEPVTPASLDDEEDDSDDLPVALDAAEAAAPPQEVEAEDQEAEDDEGEGLAPEAPEEDEVPSEPTEAPAPKAKAVKKTKPKVAAKAAPKKAKPKSAKPKAAAQPRAARTPKARGSN